MELLNTSDSDGTNLQYLADICIEKIFSMDSLTLIDLCSLAETCTRFRQVTERVFPKKLRIQFFFTTTEISVLYQISTCTTENVKHLIQ